MEKENKIEEIEKKIKENQVNILRQETSLIRIVRNIIEHGFEDDKEKRNAVIQSLLVRLFWNRTTIAIIGSLGGLVTVFFLYQQNQIIKQQNNLIKDQNTALIKQFNIGIEADYEKILLDANSTDKPLALSKLVKAKRLAGDEYINLNGYQKLFFVKNELKKIHFNDISFGYMTETIIDSSTLTNTKSYQEGAYILGSKINNCKIDKCIFTFLKFFDFEFHKDTINELTVTSPGNSGFKEVLFSDCKIEYLSLSSSVYDINIKNCEVGYINIRSLGQGNLAQGRVILDGNKGIKENGVIISLQKGIELVSINNQNIKIIDSIDKLKKLLVELENKNKNRTDELQLTSIIEWDETIKKLLRPYKEQLNISKLYEN